VHFKATAKLFKKSFNNWNQKKIIKTNFLERYNMICRRKKMKILEWEKR